MKRRQTSTRQIAEQAAQRLRELLSARADDSCPVESHHAEFRYRPSAGNPWHSHLYFEMDGPVSAEYRAALAAEYEHCLSKAREAGRAFSMLSRHDRLPTMRWSTGPPVRIRVDIHTTGGVKLWAFEQLVQRCFEQAAEGCEVRSTAPTVTPRSPTR